MHFAKGEIKELLKAWIVISIAFAIAFGGFRTDASFLIIIAMSLFTVGFGFLLHELGHKYLAQKYGCWAEFKAFDKMLGFALITSIFGIVLAVPGAVFIRGNITREKHGKVAAMGPLINVLLALAFAALFFATPVNLIQILSVYGLKVNAWLGLFNMIPFLGVDGNKVLSWSPAAYWALAIAAAMVMFVSAYFF